MAKPKYGMPRGKLKNISINELSGVDRPCQQPATVALMKRAPGVVKALFERVLKQAILTSTDEGHAHSIDLDDPACEWRDSYSTSSQTAEGAAQPHSHAWTVDLTTGVITIADDSGHGHTIAATVPSDVLAAAVLNEAAEKKRRAERNAQAAAEAVGNGTVAVTVAPVEMRAPAAISPPGAATPTVKGNSQENPTMDPKFAKMLTLALLLPEPQRAHVAKLAPDDAAAFLGLDASARDAAVKAAEAADPVVHTTKSGTAIRKSHGELALMQAKQLDAQAEQLEKQAQALAASQAAEQQATFEKRAGVELSHFAKGLGVRAAIVKALETIPDEAVRKEALEAMKGANAAMRLISKSHGTDNGGSGPVLDSPIAKFQTELETFAKANNLSEAAATAEFLKTDQGAELYAATLNRN